MKSVTIENHTCKSFSEFYNKVVESFGNVGPLRLDAKTVKFEHEAYSGLYVYTGDMFARIHD